MTAKSTIDIRAAMTGTTVAAVFALVTLLVLSLLATPPGANARLDALDLQMRAAERLSDAPAPSAEYPVGAVSRQRAAVAEAALKTRLQGAATGVVLSKLEVARSVDAGAGALASVAFTLEGRGHYDAILSMLATLNKSNPELFLDQVDLRSEISQVSVKLRGRIYYQERP